jgi:hypothetical protein
LTHIDEPRPAAEWAPRHDIAEPTAPKARGIRAALDAVSRTLDLPIGSLVPTAMAPDKESYNIDALWARIAVDLDEAKLVQLDRLRHGQRSINLRELAEQLGRAGRFVVKGIVKM